MAESNAVLQSKYPPIKNELKKEKKNPPANAGDAGSFAGSGRSPRPGNGNLLQYSCLENSMDRGFWQAAVYGVSKSHTQLSTHVDTYTHRGRLKVKE